MRPTVDQGERRRRARVNRERICQRYQAGEAARKIAVFYGVSEGFIRKLLTEAGIALRSAHVAPVSPELEAEVISAYRRGLSMRRIHAVYGLTDYRLRPLLIRAGIAIRTATEAKSALPTLTPPRALPATAAKSPAAPRPEVKSGYWQADAACRALPPEQADDFHSGHSLAHFRALQHCRACLVAADCLAYAVDNGETTGIFGGFNFARQHDRRAALALVRTPPPNPTQPPSHAI